MLTLSKIQDNENNFHIPLPGATRPNLQGECVLTWGRRVPEAAEKSPDVGRRYRCKYLRISLEISNFTSNSNTL